MNIKKVNMEKLDSIKKFIADINRGIKDSLESDDTIKIDKIYSIDGECNKEIAEFVRNLNDLINKIKEKENNKKVIIELESEVLKRRLAEELLKNERDFIQTILETGTLLVFVTDLNGKIIRFNRACEILTGYKENEVINRLIQDLFIIGKDKEYFTNEIKMVDNKENNNIFFELITKNGEKKIISLSLRSINGKTELDELDDLDDLDDRKDYLLNTGFKAIIGTGIDITEFEKNKRILENNNIELKRNQDTIKDEKDKAQKYLNIASVIIIALNRYGEVTLINNKGSELLGRKREDIIGKNWIEMAIPFRFREVDKDRFKKLINREIDENEYIESEIVNEKGETRVIAWRNSLLYDHNNNIIGTLSSGSDITKQKEIDLMKSELINTVSHEIRTPLGSILGFSELMLKRKVTHEKGQKYLKTIHKESIRLMELINDFLDIQRMENGKQVFNLNEFNIKDLINDLEKLFENNKTHKLLIDVRTDIYVFADYNKIMQVLTNLVSNAIKYSPDKDIVKLKVESIGEVLNFCIEDFGFGIEPEYLENIFTKFYRINQSNMIKIEGTGLGLAICKEIISAHGGIIWVESQLNIGSKFYFSIPITRL